MKASLALLAGLVVLFVGCGTTTTAITSGSWQTMEGPRAQDITSLLVPGQSPPAFLAGTENGEVFYAEDPRTAWTLTSALPRAERIHRFIRHPERPERLYAATGGGLFVSEDAGKSWNEVRVITGERSPVGVRALAIDPWNTSMMYAGTCRAGIRRTSDGGMTWNPANEGIPGLDTADVHEILIDPSRPDRVLAAVWPFGVARSDDAGKRWTRLTEEFKATGSTITHLAQNPQTPAIIVYGTNAGSVRRSTDGGATWSPTRNGFAEGAILSLTTLPGRPVRLLAGTESGILVSNDFGISWADFNGTLPHLPITAVPSSDGRLIFAFGEGIGLQQTADSGATWTHIDNKLGGATVHLLTADERGEHLYAALGHAVLAFDSATGLWQSAGSGLPGGKITSMAVNSDSPLHLIAATTLGGYQTTDGGQSWHAAARKMRATPQVLEAHPRIHTRMLASGTLGMDVSTDKGTTWRQTQPFSYKYRISTFTFAPRNTGVIYGAAPQAVIMTRDGGFLWESSRYGLKGEDIVAVTLDNRDPSVVYAWTSTGGGYRSLDGGLEWNKYAPPWKSTDTVLIAFDRFSPFSVIALVNGKDIYYSPSGGGTWFPLVSVTPSAQVQSLWWNAPRAVLYVGTKGKGVYCIALGKKVKEVIGE